MRKKTVYPEVKHHALDDAQPLSDKEALERYIEAENRRVEKLLRDVVEQCEWDPDFRRRLLDALPKPGRGRPVNERLQKTVVLNLMDALPEDRKDDIIEVIAKTLDISQDHAKRLYEKYRRTWLDSRRRPS